MIDRKDVKEKLLSDVIKADKWIYNHKAELLKEGMPVEIYAALFTATHIAEEAMREKLQDMDERGDVDEAR